ncbi:MAG: DnaJ domain-containing protein [Eubacteriales bacterium]|nr:DnaJ domain-containing protein [Eubacteriales bacterium]
MNPYKVLGVSENASQEEIRRAYLELVKKYHPDKYVDNPLKDLANEKLKEVNQAYDMLQKKQGSSGYSSSSSQSTYSGQYAADLQRARNYINQNNLNAAKGVLDSIPLHDAEWNYLYGILYLRWGWYDKARQHITAAYEADPGNEEYRRAYSTVQSNTRPFSSGGQNGEGGQGCDMCSVCSTLMCMNMCCNCCR